MVQKFLTEIKTKDNPSPQKKKLSFNECRFLLYFRERGSLYSLIAASGVSTFKETSVRGDPILHLSVVLRNARSSR